MITKEIVVDQITVLENGVLLYREATKIMEDSKELSKAFHRFGVNPGDDLTGKPDKVVAVAQAVWTPEVIEDFNKKSA